MIFLLISQPLSKMVRKRSMSFTTSPSTLAIGLLLGTTDEACIFIDERCSLSRLAWMNVELWRETWSSGASVVAIHYQGWTSLPPIQPCTAPTLFVLYLLQQTSAFNEPFGQETSMASPYGSWATHLMHILHIVTILNVMWCEFPKSKGWAACTSGPRGSCSCGW